MTAALIAKLESASEGSVWTDAEANEVIDALGRDRCGGAPAGIALAYLALNGSIDAALALAERVLPGWQFVLSTASHGTPAWAQAYPVGDSDDCLDAEFAPTPALAICAAILRASTAEGAGHD